MAVNNEANRRRTAYRNSVYVQGNTARKLQALPDIQRGPEKKLSVRTLKNRERIRHMSIGSVLSMAIAMTLQSDITNSIEHIAALESRLNELRLENDENYNRITNNVDLEEVKRVAIQELGMIYAHEGQIITFNGEGSDYIRQTGSLPK